MTDPISSVVAVAASPHEAKLMVAWLRAEDIPAFTDPDAAADEFAMSQRLMNLANVKVMVPTSQLERAREILAKHSTIGSEEVAQQAVAAAGPEREQEPPQTKSGTGGSPLVPWVWAIAATLLAILFLVQWLDTRQQLRTPGFDTVWNGDTYSQYLTGTKSRVFYGEDHNADGRIEKHITFGQRSSWKQTMTELDEFGFYGKMVFRRKDDLIETWPRNKATGRQDEVIVTNKAGEVVQHMIWQLGKGYVEQPR